MQMCNHVNIVVLQEKNKHASGEKERERKNSDMDKDIVHIKRTLGHWFIGYRTNHFLTFPNMYKLLRELVGEECEQLVK